LSGQKPRPLEVVSADDFDAIGSFPVRKSRRARDEGKRTGPIVIFSSRAGLATSLTGIRSYTPPSTDSSAL
jgi:hypothetical protein